TFHIENDFRAAVDRLDVDRSRSFDEHFESVAAKARDQVECFLLRERLAAGDFDQLAAVALYTRDHVIDGNLLAAGERVFRVAPSAAQIAPRQAHEDAWPAGMGRLALDALKDLRDAKHRRESCAIRRAVSSTLAPQLH